MGRRKPGKQKKESYKGPFPRNKNLAFQTVRKNMLMQSDGPTVDEFSNIDATTNYSDEVRNGVDSLSDRPRSFQAKVKNLFTSSDYSFARNIIVSVIAAVIAAYAIKLINGHDKELTKHDMQIESISKDVKENKSEIKSLSEKTNDIEKRQLLLEQKVEFNEEKTILRLSNSKEKE